MSLVGPRPQRDFEVEQYAASLSGGCTYDPA